ncbi:MAG: zinc metalloprotease HtpX [Chloroflexi bacterium]|nr:zinc metalloprotease HtpX [Chloroflexota bacterium]
MNTLKTGVLLLFLTFLLLATGYLVGGVEGVLVFLVISLAMNFFGFWFSDRLVLAMSGAKEVTPDRAPELYRVVEEQARLAVIPVPKVFIMETESPNAFATGRSKKHASVAVTRGIMRILNRDELGGVLAHELAHVGNRDTFIMTMVAAIAGAISMIAWMAQWSLMFGGMGGRDRRNGGGSPIALIGLLIVVIVMPLAALLVRLAISRAREFQADRTGGLTSGMPLALASALRKLERGARAQPMAMAKERLEPVSHLFIVNPLKGDGLTSLFATHPPTEERIRRLEALEQARTSRSREAEYRALWPSR